jgi:hypothetical protein
VLGELLRGDVVHWLGGARVRVYMMEVYFF